MSTWNPGSSGGDDTGSLLLLLLLGLIVAPFFLPGMVAGAERWLLEHRVLVPSAQALLTLPWTHSGLDGRRLTALCLTLIGGGAALTVIRRKASHVR